MPRFLPILIVTHNTIYGVRMTLSLAEMVPGERVRFIEERQVLPTVQ